MNKIEEEKKKFNEWWSYVTSNSNSWTTLQRIAAHDSWMAARGLSGYIKPPEPKLEVGKSYRSIGGWFVINRKGDEDNYGFSPYGEFRDNLLCSTHDFWQEIPESEVIALLEKGCVRRYGEGWRDMKIKDCVFEPGHELVNSDSLSVFISTHMILNKNGCIFKDGVWAEKLEEPFGANETLCPNCGSNAIFGMINSDYRECHSCDHKWEDQHKFKISSEEDWEKIWDKIFGTKDPKIKDGQMIWVKDENQYHWSYSVFNRFKEGKIVTVRPGTEYSYTWDEYSLTNPYPDSIEARAIEFLKEASGHLDIINVKHNEIKRFLQEIESYDK